MVRLPRMTTLLHKVARGTQRTIIPVPEAPSAKELLVDIVLAVTANVDWTQPGFEGRLGRTPTRRGEVMLATLTYCYALGMFSSAHIETEIYRNRNNAELLAQMNLDRRSLAQFRRYNRDLIKICLTQVLGRLNTSISPAEEAERRIDNAVTHDFLESEQ
jgi:hypothetical protein